jgi:Protein of unknown function (DUF1566)
MNKTLLTILTLILTVTLGAQITRAIGSLTLSGTAGDATQYTLNDIYTKLTTNTSTSTKSGMFTTPGSAVATFRTLTEIYNAIPTIDATKIATGTSYFGVAGTLAAGLPKTGQTTSYVANDDGDLEIGIAPAYIDNGDGTITDNATGLIWQKNGTYNASSWQDAINYCTNNVATLPGSGWRLPNYKELISIVDLGRANPSINPVFTTTQSGGYWDYWSSTMYYGYNNNYPWYVNFNEGYTGGSDLRTNSSNYTRCVR